MFEALPADARIAILAEIAVVVAAVCEYSTTLGIFLYALVAAAAVVSTTREA
jgi:hypothetical protein